MVAVWRVWRRRGRNRGVYGVCFEKILRVDAKDALPRKAQYYWLAGLSSRLECIVAAFAWGGGSFELPITNMLFVDVMRTHSRHRPHPHSRNPNSCLLLPSLPHRLT